MLYSRSAQYAIRALVHIASLPQDEYSMARTIAKDADIPAHFLAKILQDLARDGFLKSIKGPGGGFRLAQPAREISLLRVVESVDGSACMNRCPMGLGECTGKTACGMHAGWKAVRSRIMEYMGATSVADVAKSLNDKSQKMGEKKLPRPRRHVENRVSGR